MNYIVCGPPGSGKTTYVQEHRTPNDLIVDVDAIFHAITGLPLYEKPDSLVPVALGVRDYLIGCILQNGNAWYNSWVIMGGARQSERQRLARRLDAQVVILEIGWSDCVRRIQESQRPSFVKRSYPALIEKWWKDYERDRGDLIITLKDQLVKG